MSRKTCFYCERPFNRLYPGEVSGGEHVFKTRDHVIPRSRGGSHHHKNIVEACDKCNRLKANKLLEEFVEFLTSEVRRHCYHGYKKANFLLIIHNAGKLIEQIAPYRQELIYQASEINAPPIKHIEHIASPPVASLQQEKSQKQFLAKFKKMYPYAFDLMSEANPDLPRWIFDNLIQKEII